MRCHTGQSRSQNDEDDSRGTTGIARFIAALVVIALLALAVSSPSAVAQDDKGPERLSDRDAYLEDGALLGVIDDKAIDEAMKFQDEFVSAVEKAGGHAVFEWIEQSPLPAMSARVVVAAGAKPDAGAMDELRALGVEVAQGEGLSMEAQIEAASIVGQRLAQTADGPEAATVGISSPGVITVTVAKGLDGSALELDLAHHLASQKGVTSVGVEVLTTDDKLITPDMLNPQGGAKVSTLTEDCTTAFPIYDFTLGHDALLTAGHCDTGQPGPVVWDHFVNTLLPSTFGETQVGWNGDFGYISPNAEPWIWPVGYWASSTSWRNVNATQVPWLGLRVCAYGRTSNQRFCRMSVTDVGTGYVENGVYIGHLTRATTDPGYSHPFIPGDSGGPVSWGSTAQGIIQSRLGGSQLWFTDVEQAASSLGAFVLSS